jgi:hypothetical protein
MIILCSFGAKGNPPFRTGSRLFAPCREQAVASHGGHAVARVRRSSSRPHASNDEALIAPAATAYPFSIRLVVSSASIPAALARPPPATPPRQPPHNVEVRHQLIHKGMER